METRFPKIDPYLPVNVSFWDGASPFFDSEALFVDLPFSHRSVGLKIAHLNVREAPYKILMFGFLDRHDGPTDALEWAVSNGYQCEEYSSQVKHAEKSERFIYRLTVARKALAATPS